MNTQEHTNEEKQALTDFFKKAKVMGSEGEAAGVAASEAMPRIARAVARKSNDITRQIQPMLKSLFNGGFTKCELKGIGDFPWPLQRDLAAIALGLNKGPFADESIKAAFAALGETALQWFLDDTPIKAGNDELEIPAHDEALANAAGRAGRLAMYNIAEAIACQHSGQPYRLRALLNSLMYGGAVDFSNIQVLDWNLRKDFCAVLAGINRNVFSSLYIEEAFGEVADVDGIKWLHQK